MLAPAGKADRSREFASSLTSMVLTVPGFDQTQFDGKCYVRMTSKEIQIGEATVSGKKDKVVKVPTDDGRVMAVLIPQTLISESS